MVISGKCQFAETVQCTNRFETVADLAGNPQRVLVPARRLVETPDASQDIAEAVPRADLVRDRARPTSGLSRPGEVPNRSHRLAELPGRVGDRVQDARFAAQVAGCSIPIYSLIVRVQRCFVPTGPALAHAEVAEGERLPPHRPGASRPSQRFGIQLG